MASNIRTGTVNGTGAAINVSLGWQPDYVKVMNIADAGALDAIIEWTVDMPAAAGMKYLRIVDNATTTNKSHAYVTSGGISAYAGSASAAEGFTIGTDTDLNASGEKIVWIAMRSPRG
ncbi:hypothetical protein J2847_004131 [Azospirillum agricola]|uniref:hypothetical protein n=1 Tax=Azospirillum agricola TaxID=1720247 RepID=UPI001AE42773|nr:hypothetical protein [Azospirillum agricola]MBP2230822.1 hypothetical protein [Azospirillum agricola]